VWQRYEQQQPGEQQEPNGGDEALSTNGERRSSINCREPFVDKIVSEQMSTNFECQRARNAQTVPQNPSSLYGVGTDHRSCVQGGGRREVYWQKNNYGNHTGHGMIWIAR
jgi:hypothetical protein